MIKTLRTRFILVAMLCMIGVMAVLVAAINVTNYSQTMDIAYQTIDYLMETKETGPKEQNRPSQKPGEKPETATDVKEDKEDHHPKFPEEDKKGLSPEKPFSARYFSVLLNHQGEVLETDISQIASVNQQQAVEIALECFSNNQTNGTYNNYVFRQSHTTDGWEYFFLNCEDDFAYFRSFLWTSIGISLGGIALVFVLVWFFLGMVMRPIAESYEKQKRFITDAGHELKTPLTIIDANAEVLEMERGESPWTKSIRNQVSRLSDLTQKLVFLSRMEEESTLLSFTDFSLSDAVEETAGPFEAVATAGEKSLEIRCKEGVSYYGDESTIRQLISLLLDNAMKYTNQGGTIAVTLTENGKKKQITVSNTVEQRGTLSPALWFDRFYRQETSRNSTTGGHGIGLSVAQAIVNAHKGKITAAYQGQNTVVITVTL